MAKMLITRATSILSLALLVTSNMVLTQSVTPSNDTSLLHPSSDLSLFISPSLNNEVFKLEPLTINAGLGAQPGTIDNSGTLQVTTPDTINQINPNTICFISCENASYPGFIDGGTVLRNAAAMIPEGIILYSTVSDHCNYSADATFRYKLIYSMVGANNSNFLYSKLNDEKSTSFSASINNNYGPAGSGNSTSQDGDPFGPRPTTQIAMIILYSITGVITALFLVIIATGAVRAHRHPERYGPRAAGVLGRARQSRAKGIARAMLETLPIVKFGTDDKAQTDTELANGEQGDANELAAADSQQPHPRDGNSAEDSASDHPPKHVSDNTEATSGTDGPTSSEATGAGTASRESRHSESGNKDEGLVCSICTEDFVKGEDIRVLPCDHKYHPACVDPWLLNVSGTCPLCRIDLRPAATAEAPEGAAVGTTTEITAGQNDDLAPPLAEAEGGPVQTPHSRNRIARYLELRRMEPSERMATLRAMREEHRSNSLAVPQGEAGDRRSSRLSTLLSHAFHIRTREMPDPTGDSPADENNESNLVTRGDGRRSRLGALAG